MLILVRGRMVFVKYRLLVRLSSGHYICWALGYVFLKCL